MQALRELQTKAMELRKSGYSLSEIATELDVSKSSVSLWVRNVTLDESAQDAIKKKREKARIQAGNTKRAQVDKKLSLAFEYGLKVVAKASMNTEAKQLLCALLYWCEGVKIRRTNTFGFTNSDPNLVRLFMQLLRENFEIDESRLRLTLHVHEYHDADAQLQFWSKLTTIPLSQCHKPYLKPHTGTRKRDKYQGCVSIRYFDVEFARKLEGIAIAYLQGPIG